MSKARARRRQRRTGRGAARPQQARRRRVSWRSSAGWGATALVLAGVALLIIRGPGQSTANPTLVALAEESSGGPVRVLTGTAHTVYHSTLPVPSQATPRSDGRPTLIWFSGTWCTFCERMEPFAHNTASQFTDRLAFVEKSVDHDRTAASRYGVRGTPTFVLVDAVGNEITRFHYQSSAAAFADIILSALDRVES
ncbi:MAG: thioredoxin domain-containing protein [Dehalococcoidia bacterium]